MEKYCHGTLKRWTVFNATDDPCIILYEYNDYGRLIREDYPDGGYVQTIRDGFGRKAIVEDYRNDIDNIGGTSIYESKIRYEYDTLNRLVRKTDQDGYQVKYTYRPDGQPYSIFVSPPGGGDDIYATYYFYAPDSRLSYMRENSLYELNDYLNYMTYDENGNRKQMLYFLDGNPDETNNVTIDYDYNRRNLLTSLSADVYTTTTTELFNLDNMVVDGLGRLRAADESISDTTSTTRQHNYDFAYNMRSELTNASITNIDGDTWDAGFEYGKDGNIQNRTGDDPCIFTYTGDLMTGAEGEELDWDENGNLITGLDNSAYIYNWDDKLRSATVGTDTVQVKYDPDGNRIYKSVNGTARKYIIAEIGGLSVILMELDSGFNIQKSYVYDTTAQIQTQYDGNMATGDKYFYIHDRLGSVRQVIDVNGNVVHLYTYGPYGKKLEVDDAPAAPGNPYQYTGLYADEELDQYHARARQIYPAIYRFTSRDPIYGKYKEPLTLHTYLYCLNDPINHKDLTGEMAGMLGGSGLSSDLRAKEYKRSVGALHWARRYITQINKGMFKRQLQMMRQTMGKYTSRTYRQELLKKIGNQYSKCKVHHRIPQAFRNKANKVLQKYGLSIDHPWFTTALEEGAHVGLHAQGYNAAWAGFFAANSNPTALEIIDFAIVLLSF